MHIKRGGNSVAGKAQRRPIGRNQQQQQQQCRQIPCWSLPIGGTR